MAQEQLNADSLNLAIDQKNEEQISKHRAKNIPITPAHISRAIQKIGAENSVPSNTKTILNMVFRYADGFNVLTEAALKTFVMESLNSRNKTAIDVILQSDKFNKALKIDDEIIICAIKNILAKTTASLDPLFDLLDFAVKKGHPLTSRILDELLNVGKITQRNYPLFIQQICERLVKIKDFKFSSEQILNAVKFKPVDGSTWQLVDAAIKTNSPLSEDVFIQYLENGANNYQGFNLDRVWVIKSPSPESDIADIHLSQKPNYPLLVEIEDSRGDIKYRLYEKNEKNQITFADLSSDSVEQYPIHSPSTIKTQHINSSETPFLFNTLKKQSDLVQDTANKLLNVIAKNNGVTEKSLNFAVVKKDEYWIKTIYKSIASQTPETKFSENKILGNAFLAVSDDAKKALIDTAAEKRPNDLAVFLDYAVDFKLEKIAVDTIIPKLAKTNIQIKLQLVINTINFLGEKLTAENLFILWDKLDKNNINENLLKTILKYYSLSDQAYKNIAIMVFDELTARQVLVGEDFDGYTKKHAPKAKEDQKPVSGGVPPSSPQTPGSPPSTGQQGQPGPVPAAVDYNAIRGDLVKHWNKVIDKFKESDYDYIEQRTTRFTAFNAIDTLLKNDPLTKQHVIDVYENINHVLNTKTAKFYLKPAIYESLLNFQRQVEFDCAYICDTSKDAGKNLLSQIRQEVNQFLINRKAKNSERPEDRHDGLVDVGKIDATKLDAYGDVKDAAFFYLVKQIAHQRLNDKFNFIHKITRNKDVAEFYKLFEETSLFTVNGSPKEIEYNTSSLTHLRDKLQQFNQKLQSEITPNKTPGLSGN